LSTAGARDRACEQFSGPLPIFGSCAMGASSPGVPLPDIRMGDARLGRPFGSSCPLDPLSRGFSTWLAIGSAPGVWLPFAVLIPHMQGSGRFRSLQTPLALCRRASFPDGFCRAAAYRAVPGCLKDTRGAVARWRWLRFRDRACAPDVWSAAELTHVQLRQRSCLGLAVVGHRPWARDVSK